MNITITVSIDSITPSETIPPIKIEFLKPNENLKEEKDYTLNISSKDNEEPYNDDYCDKKYYKPKSPLPPFPQPVKEKYAGPW